MKYGLLSDYFDGAGAKRLTEVEVNRHRSHQHEFQGVGAFRTILGTPEDKVTFPATFYWLDDDEDSEPINLDSFCTWSDVRRDNPARTSEFHLYYAADSEDVVHRARADDLLVIAMTKQKTLLVVLCPANTTVEQQLLWLFGLTLGPSQVDVKPLQSDNSIRLGIAAKSILDDLGIEPDEPEPDALDRLIDRYRDGFPTTSEFSQFARDTLADIDPAGLPDDALVAWMDHEEALFYHLERHIVSERLKTGFTGDNGANVDCFVKFSLSVHNRRKSRAGWAFGHHIEALLKAHNIHYTREARTENQKKPDFLFPGEAEYRTPSYNSAMLTMLGAKRSCKDRWRQVLSEANKIEKKHLLTLQPAISVPQTDEMKAAKLQLVVPRSIFDSYQPEQKEWLLNVEGFIDLVRKRQEA